MLSRLPIIFLLGIFFGIACCAADKGRIVEIDSSGGADIPPYIGLNTNMVAVGEWSKPVFDGRGNSIRTRILVYTEQRHLTNALDATGHWVELGPKNSNGSFTKSNIYWLAAPVYLEIEDLRGEGKPPVQIYFDRDNGIHFELRDATGAAADNLRKGGGGSMRSFKGFWASVPPGGVLRIHANTWAGSTQMNGGSGN